jgi:hypothetical protein
VEKLHHVLTTDTLTIKNTNNLGIDISIFNIRCTYLFVRMLMRSRAKLGKIWALGEKKNISLSHLPVLNFALGHRLNSIIF